jgi:hypothetical protein
MKTVRLRVGTAYNPSDRGANPGGNHWIVADELRIPGRLYRAPGDALCKPARKFWGLSDVDEERWRFVTCKRCHEMARRWLLVEGPPTETELYGPIGNKGTRGTRVSAERGS